MVDKNKLSKDVEEQIQSLASDVYIQVEEKLTLLITTAVKAEMSQKTVQQSKDLSDKEESLQKGFSEKNQLQTNEIEKLKQALAEKKIDEETAKQNFQVEITQKSINYSETIEALQKELDNLNKNSKQEDAKKSSDINLEEKLLEAEQKVNDKSKEVDGLNGRIMVLTEQEQNLAKQLVVAKENAQLSDKKQNEAVTASKAEAEASAKQQIDALNEKIKQFENESARIKAEAEASAKQQIDALNEKIKQFENESARIKAEALQSNDSKVKELDQKIVQLTEQIKQEQNGKAELQQQLSEQQKAIDTEQDKNKQAEQRSQDYQAKIIKITEQAVADKQPLMDQIKSLNEGTEQLKQQHVNDIKVINEAGELVKQQHLDEIKAINTAGQEAKGIQSAAQQNIIELEKANVELTKNLEIEKNDVKLTQQEVTVLNEQLKVAQDGQENILQRFNSNREKQEIENTKVRDTIKFLRDENHELTSASVEQKTDFTAQLNELEHKITEYRLKFEYAQKQLVN